MQEWQKHFQFCLTELQDTCAQIGTKNNFKQFS